jgi:hypothetical protein
MIATICVSIFIEGDTMLFQGVRIVAKQKRRRTKIPIRGIHNISPLKSFVVSPSFCHV